MSKDMMYCYIKEKNKKCGRNGYYVSIFGNGIIVKPKDYGMFLQDRKKNSKPK